MSGFNAGEVELQAAAGQLRTVAEDLDADFAVLRDQVQQMLAGRWRGGAAKGFGVGWAEWLEGYGLTIGALRKMAGLLSTTGADYGMHEQDVVQHLQAVRSELS